MGDLRKLSALQEEFRARLVTSGRGDSWDEVMQQLGLSLPEEELINVAIIHMEMVGSEIPSLDDLIWAGEFLDHLDTLNWKITPKNRSDRRKGREHNRVILDAPSFMAEGGRDHDV